MRIRSLFASCTLVLALFLSLPAAAQQPEGHFDYFGAQLLYGGPFDDRPLGYAPRDGRMLTLTLENFSEWAYGDSYFFFDLASGDFGDAPSDKYRIYGEWNPRLSLSKLLGKKVGVLFIEDVVLAGEVNRGPGFNALLAGPGVNLRVPGVALLQLHAYARKDNFNPLTWQVTTIWFAPFDVGPLRFTFGGFADILGLQGSGVDVLTQPQLLWDVGKLAGWRPDTVKVGVEWWLHRTADSFTSAPQGMIRLAY